MFEIGDDVRRHTGRVDRQAAGLGQQMKNVDRLFISAAEFRDHFGYWRGEMEHAVLDQFQRDRGGQGLGQRHQMKHRVGFQRHARVAIGIAFAEINDYLATTRDAQRDAITATCGDVGIDAARGVETEGANVCGDHGLPSEGSLAILAPSPCRCEFIRRPIRFAPHRLWNECANNFGCANKFAPAMELSA